jgi:acetyl esterase/lipase
VGACLEEITSVLDPRKPSPSRRFRALVQAAVVSLSAFLAGCSGAGIDAGLAALNAVIPSNGYERTSAVSFGDEPRQKLDVYRPKNGSSGHDPVVLFFYGGSWKYGDRGQYRFLADALTAEGFVVVIPDYRLYPTVTFPAFMQDAAKALRWTAANIRSFGGDPSQLYVMGHSAGGHIAALLTLDPRFMAAEGISEQQIRGLIGLAGPYAFRPDQTASVRDVFAAAAASDDARPITFIGRRGAPPPMFLAHGKGDDTVSIWNAQTLTAAARGAGGHVTEAYYEGIGHLGIMAAFARPFRSRAPVLRDVVDFIRTHGAPVRTAAQ